MADARGHDPRHPTPAEAHAEHHGDAHVHIVPVGTYIAVFLTLLVMTGLTVWAANQDFGPFNMVVALGIAIFKASLVILFFMHVKYSGRLTQLVVGSAFLWLAILIIGTMHDYYAPELNNRINAPSISRE